MIDLSVMRDPVWIEHRKALWQEQEVEFKQYLRKKDLKEIEDYFMSAILAENDTLGDAAKFAWFPIQNTDGWNYLFENIIEGPQFFEEQFYFQFNDLSKRALTLEQELEMWDYFAGKEFQPGVTSKVPVGKEKELVKIVVNKESLVSAFNVVFKGFTSTKDIREQKWIRRLDYFTSMLPYIEEANFERKRNIGDFPTRTGRLIGSLFKFLFKPKFGKELGVTQEWIENHLVYLQELIEIIDQVDMQPSMRKVWEDSKSKGLTK